jgi:hypothetical protein
MGHEEASVVNFGPYPDVERGGDDVAHPGVL